MADKELRKLKRRELLEMLLVQCEETERLQQKLRELTETHEQMSESYERLKIKLNVKDERLNQKDEQIKNLRKRIEDIQASKVIELEEAGSIAEASLRLNGIFEAAQRAAEQYLMNVKRIAKSNGKDIKKNGEDADQVDTMENMEVSEMLAVPEERTGYRNFTVFERHTTGGQRIPYETGRKMVSRRKKLHG